MTWAVFHSPSALRARGTHCWPVESFAMQELGKSWGQARVAGWQLSACQVPGQSDTILMLLRRYKS